MFSSSLTFFFLGLTSLCCPSLAAPAVQEPPSAVQATTSPVETFFPIDGSYPLPAPASAEMDRIEDLSPELTAFVFDLKSLPPKVDEQPPSMAINQSTDFNQLENLYCLTEFKVGGAGRLGFMVNYYDRVVNQNQSVAFTADGPELYLAYRLLRRHTNKDGFYEDINLFRSPQGLNVGYDATGKSLNVAGWTPQVKYDGSHQFDKLQVACRDAFGIEADGPSGSFYQKYAGDFVPSLLSPEPIQSS
jgi:hypothetical protein